MPIEVGLWRLGDKPERVTFSSIETEKKLEDILADDISILDPNILLIGRQVVTAYGKLVDLILKDRAVEIDVPDLAEQTWKKVEAAGCAVRKGESGMVTIRLPAGTQTYDVLDILKQAPTDILEVRPQKESLEDLFIRTLKEETN